MILNTRKTIFSAVILWTAFAQNTNVNEALQKFLNDDVQPTELHGGGGELAPVYSSDWWFYISISIFCSCFAGVMSGLTIGLLSIDMLDLEICLLIGAPDKKKSVSQNIIFNLNSNLGQEYSSAFTPAPLAPRDSPFLQCLRLGGTAHLLGQNCPFCLRYPYICLSSPHTRRGHPTVNLHRSTLALYC